jgi:hypothetical protein
VTLAFPPLPEKFERDAGQKAPAMYGLRISAEGSVVNKIFLAGI